MIPTLTELYNSILSDLEAQFQNNIPLFGKNSLRALAMVQAGKLKLYYIAIAKVQKNTFADTADSESIGGTLERIGRIKIGRNPFPATAGVYTLQLTGTVGSIVPASTTFKADDDSASPGELFILDNAYTLDGITDQIDVRALTSGVGARLDISNTLTPTAPIANVESSASVLYEVSEPQAEETDDDYRRKILESFQLEPQGGSGSDYRLWSNEVQGVNQSYPFVESIAPHDVNLFIEATTTDSTDGKGTPSAQLLLDVESSIEDPTPNRPARKPITDLVNYLPVTPLDVDIVINGYVGLTAAKSTSIENAISDEMTRIRPFVGSIDVLANKNDILDTNKIISLILSAVPGSVFGAVELTVDSVLTASYTFQNGDIPSFSSVTYA